MSCKELNELLLAWVFSSTKQAPNVPKQKFSQKHYLKSKQNHLWNIALFRNSKTAANSHPPQGLHVNLNSPLLLSVFKLRLLFSFAPFPFLAKGCTILGPI